MVDEKTYDVVFNSDKHSNSNGFISSLEFCLKYIESGKDDYFKSYAGGTVSVVCNETGEIMIELEI